MSTFTILTSCAAVINRNTQDQFSQTDPECFFISRISLLGSGVPVGHGGAAPLPKRSSTGDLHGQQPIVPGAVVGEGKRLDDDCTISVDHGCLVLSLGDVDANDVHSIGSSRVQITDIPRAAEGHNLLRD